LLDDIDVEKINQEKEAFGSLFFIFELTIFWNNN